MLIFIDESGDPGFSITKGSSVVFVVACVIFDDELEAEKTAIKIKELRRKLKKSDNFEFKFNKCSRKIRVQFLETVRGSEFRIRSIVMKKENIYSEELKTNKESFYNFTIRTVLKHNFGRIKDAKIRIDGKGDRLFRKELLTYLNKHLKTKEAKIIRNFKFRNSQKDVLIQLADMVAGSINRRFQSDKTDSKIYLDILQKRIDDLWEFK
ncbi:MAG: hypothetical protein UT11_C0017G0007 [Berkelbacteria bacterium GW2011_GWA2_38_9]|uniref:DUF3800 domain-containing protein n=1 Tax=Berkelbacteria bacterium GW2011_GWA2_38_9 TaxID=1618334 RepID=A0A0G0NVH3_9BACT|nr:MAG: hypothetical protein UT11_C0017G0007 [Berkelbacteria bacterium GW2011_GWA2_38_9]